MALVLLVLAIVGPASGSNAPTGRVRAADLRCEYLVNPLGIDVARPRLSWVLQSDERGQRQTACRILVASTAEKLAADQGDWWDSGRVASDEPVHVAYAGRPLPSRAVCHWKVMVWDNDGRASAWSQPACWSMGLLTAADWQARWISDARGIAAEPWPNGYRSLPARTDQGAKWIVLDLGKPKRLDGVKLWRARPSWREDVAGYGFPLRFRVEVANQADLGDARLVVDQTAADVPDPFTGAPEYRFAPVTARYVRLTATKLRPLPSGEFVLALEEMMVLDGRRNVAPGATVSACDSLDNDRWSRRFLVDGIFGHRLGDVIDSPMPWLRKTFVLAGRPQRATAYVAAVGYYELYVNGHKVDDHVLTPAVSELSRRAFYVVHDVKRYLTPGRNCLALWLGRGWAAWKPYRLDHAWMVKAQLEAVLGNGQNARVFTDGTWKTHPSPVTILGAWQYANYGGERYDATREVPDWNAASLDDVAWQPACEYAGPGPRVVAQMIEPNRITESFRPKQILERRPGLYVVDMGRHFTGTVEMRLEGPRGRKVRLEYSELPDQACTDRQVDEYVLRGGAPEVFRNRFNYHGFRWMTVAGLDRAPSLDDVKGCLVHPDYASASRFECSSPLLNRIDQTTRWTYRCLTLGGYVVDCPHRERLGYGAEGQAGMDCGLYSFDQAAMMAKWLADWRDVQDPHTGHVPHTAPQYIGGGGPTWGGILVTLPWQVYLQYGDRRVLADCFPHMEKYLAWLDTRCRDGLLQPWGVYMDFLADWVAPGRDQGGLDTQSPEVCRRMFNDCYHVYLLRLTSQAAAAIGKPDRAAHYRRQAKRTAQAVHKSYFHPETNTYANGEQPYLAMPLLLGVTPPELRKPVLDNLDRDIRITRAGHIHAGVLGTWLTLKALAELGRNDLVYAMASQTTYPGWGHMLDRGATTFWERWDGLHSQIHTSFLPIGSWFVRDLAGIQPDERLPGFKHIILRPAVVGDLTFARATYRSLRGTIESHWRRQPDQLTWEITIPPGTSATVYVPTRAPTSIRESGRPIAESPHIRPLPAEPRAAVYEVGSGRYTFTSPL